MISLAPDPGSNAVSSATELEITVKHTRLEEPREPTRFEKLQCLMEWRKAALVESPEFKIAKRELLGMEDN